MHVDHAWHQDALDEHIDAIRAGRGRGQCSWPAPEWIGADPAGNATNDQTGESAVARMRRAGLVVKTRRMGVHESLNVLRARLAPAAGTPTIKVHERCQTLIESLERYHYAPSSDDDSPVKTDGFDHAVDALRYLVHNLDMPFRSTMRRYA